MRFFLATTGMLLLATTGFAQPASPILQMDTDKDGSLSKQEFIDGMLPQVKERLGMRFDAMDTNKDGQLTEQERREAGQRMRLQHAPGQPPAPTGVPGAQPQSQPPAQ